MRLLRFASQKSIETIALPLQADFVCQRQRKHLSHRRWKRNSFLVVSTFALIASMKSIAAEDGAKIPVQRIGSGDPVNGKEKSDEGRCQECLGESGKGRVVANVIYPVIGGQRAVYLRSQLVNWRLGDRSNSPGGVMNKIAKLLSDDEIDALADYISGL